jgi:hypothetical protein
MTEKEVAERWAEICRSAESAGKSALRIIEANLLRAMNDLAAMEADRNRWVDVAGERAATELPAPLNGLVRAHGLHIIDSMTGKLREVAADYEVDHDDGVVQVLYVYLGAHEIMSLITPEHDLVLCKQIAARIAAEQLDRAEP